eukprot:scaffold198760_cov28-Tisochrysis_lutea.AAC.2
MQVLDAPPHMSHASAEDSSYESRLLLDVDSACSGSGVFATSDISLIAEAADAGRVRKSKPGRLGPHGPELAAKYSPRLRLVYWVEAERDSLSAIDAADAGRVRMSARDKPRSVSDRYPIGAAAVDAADAGRVRSSMYDASRSCFPAAVHSGGFMETEAADAGRVRESILSRPGSRPNLAQLNVSAAVDTAEAGRVRASTYGTWP